MGNQASDMHADTVTSEMEAQERRATRHSLPRTAERMENSVKCDEEGVTELPRSDGDSENGDGNNYRGCYDPFIGKLSMMLLGCFGMSLGDLDQSYGESIRSPLIMNRMIGSTEIAADIGGSGKKSFLEWLNRHDFDQSDEDWESALVRLKDGVIQLGIRLSHLLLDFLILASKRGDNMEIFADFRDILGARILGDYKTLVVVNNVLNLVEMVEKEVTNLKNKGKEILEGEISTDSMKHRKDSIDLADNFCSQILTLHFLVSKYKLTKSDLVEKVEESFGEIKEELNKIEQDMSKLRVQLLSSAEEDSQTVEVLERQLVSKVRGMWSGFGQNQRSD